MTTMAGTAAWPRQARGVPCMATRQMESRKEAEHKRFLETRHQEEERRARHNLRRRAIKKRELMETFRRRRLQNFCSEAQVTGTMRARPQPPPSVRNPHHHRDHDHPADPPKERTFCKRNGFIWSDLERTPKARLSLVVPPIAVKRDRECLERLLSTVDKEELEAREGARRQRERIAAQHDKLQLLASPRKARQAQIMAAITKKSDTKTAHNVSSELCRSGNQPNQDTAVLPAGEKDMKRAGRVMSRRQEQLAQPREPADLKTAYIMLGSTDLTGLLHTEPAMRGVLEGHLDDLRQDLTAARFLKHTGPTQTQTVVAQIELAAAAASIGGGGGGGGGGGRGGGGGGGGGGGCGRSGVSEKNPHHHRHNNKEPHVMARAGRAAGWPYTSVTVEGVASVEFDPRATLGDEESLSAA